MLMTEKHAKRLLKLADHLESLPRGKFDIKSWFRGLGKPKCGTVACAMGHACLIPSFRRAGLRPDSYFSGTSHHRPVFEPKSHDEREACLARHLRTEGYASTRYVEYKAAAYFFGLTSLQAEELFHPFQYQRLGRPAPTNKFVAKRIRDVVNLYHPALVA